MYQPRFLRTAPPDAADTPVTVPMKPAERWFHIVTMITQFGGILPVYQAIIGADSLELGASSPLNTVMMTIILVVSLVLGFRYRQNIIRAFPGMLPIVGLLLLALASALWSEYPDISVRRAGTAITTALWGAYLASRFGLRDIINLIAQSTLIIAIASLFAAILFPSVGVNPLLESDPDGVPGWGGIVGDKNSLGITMATAMISMLYLAISPGTARRARWLWLASFLFCTLVLYESQSRTAWVAAIAGVLVCFTVRVMYCRPALAIVVWTLLVGAGIPAVIYAVNDIGAFTALLGKDATLTGRVDLWAEVLPWGDKRPLLGYGYAAFWVEDSPITQSIWQALNSYHPPHAHNGWIETYLELGLIGCFLVALQIVEMLLAAVRATTSGRDVDSPYILMIVVVLLIFNMVEADLIRAPALFWPFLIIGPVALTKVLKPPPAPARDWAMRDRSARYVDRRAGAVIAPRRPIRPVSATLR